MGPAEALYGKHDLRDNHQMPAKTAPNRLLQITAVAFICIFVLGFALPALGAWTGSVLSAWFIGTQRPWRGFLLLAGISLILNLISIWRALQLGGIGSAGWTILAVLISVLPFLLYRLANQRWQDFLSTLALPLWGVAFEGLERFLLPAGKFNLHSLAQTQSALPVVSSLGAILGSSPITFFIYWFAAVMVWIWDQGFRLKKVARGASVFIATGVLVLGYGFSLEMAHAVAPHAQRANEPFTWICLVGGLILSVCGLIQLSTQRRSWAHKAETVALLRSPYTGETLTVVNEDRHAALVSRSGERFPIRSGIPVFVEPDKLSGSNLKLNRLYESIGGFYDDTQKVACALRGIRPSQYFSHYLRWLEIKPGDLVLETSVGTGLNFKYLPRGARLFGLDLSAEMLTNCQANLRRWEMDADLFLGNAEDLPFANNSFDVVFHVGGINFFNDRAKAIREMIRVAKPGTRILIADETEKHVKGTYERAPFTSRYFRNRQGPVTAPIDLVPPEMHEIHLEILRDGQFYALTFRKPASEQELPSKKVSSL
jgi:ubiquinone/menaquinone biosynthesis C-methylase UbiE